MKVLEVKTITLALTIGASVGCHHAAPSDVPPPPYVPPSVAGFQDIAEARECAAVAVGDDELWLVRYERATGWFEANYRVSKVGLATNRVETLAAATQGLYFPGIADADLAVTNERVWIVSRFNFDGAADVVGFSRTGGDIEAAVELVDSVLTGLAATEDAVWVASSDLESEHALYRIDPGTADIVGTIPLHRAPVDVGVTPGAVWTLQDDRTLTRVDAVTNRVLGAIRLPADYDSVTTSADAVWLVAARSRSVARLDPAVNEIVATMPFDPHLEAATIIDLFVGDGAVWTGSALDSTPDQERDGSELWLAEIDPTTAHVRRKLFAGLIGASRARIATADGDVFVCSNALSRIPLDELAKARSLH